MKLLAWICWAIAIVWLVLVLVGSSNFQELYGGSSGLQVVLLGLVVAIVPALIGWWAYRRSK